MEKITEQDIIKALTNNYNATYYLDLENEIVNPIDLGDRIEFYMGSELRSSKHYSEYVDYYAENMVHPDYRVAFKYELCRENLQKKLKNRQSYTFTYIGKKEDKDNYYRMRASRIRDMVNHLIISFEDVDLEVRQQNEAMKQLEVAVREAMEAGKMKQEFLSNMSHELRTPLNAISGFKEIAALNIDSPEDLIESLQYIGSATRQMTYLVNNILNMSNLISGSVELQDEVCCLEDLVKDIETVIVSEAEEKCIHFAADMSEAGTENVVVDKSLLNRVLMNLLGNAVKFTNPHGAINLKIKQVKNGSLIANYEMRVKDNGIGMSEEFKNHLFEMFSRERTTTNSGIYGCGLGMAVTKRILDMMGGTIEVESAQGVGTEFIVRVPLRMA